MSAPKVGDRVRVESFEATVLQVHTSGLLKLDDTYCGTSSAINANHLTVLPPEFKVGDVIDAVEAKNLPLDSVVLCALNRVAYQVRDNLVNGSGRGLYVGPTRLNEHRGGECRILYIGGQS